MSARLPAWHNPNLLSQVFQPYYRTDLPFHNLSHGRRSGLRSRRIAEIAIAVGADIEADILTFVGFGHDTGTWLVPGVDHNFDNAEAYSADLAWVIGKSLDIPKPKLELAYEVINSSGPGMPCETDTARCFRRGDLADGGIQESPTAFLNGTYRLYLEKKIIEGQEPASLARPHRLVTDLVQFGVTAHDVLNRLTAEDLRFQSIDQDEQFVDFSLRAANNIRLLSSWPLQQFLGRHLKDVVGYQPIGI